MSKLELPPFTSFCTARNLRSHLVRSKLYPLKRKTGSWKCKFQRCLTCKNVLECNTSFSFVTKVFKINHHFDCNSKCLAYLMLCKVCGKQYVGSTTERFRFRKADKGENDTQKYFHEDFLSHDQNVLINDIEIIFIDQADPSGPTRTEKFWSVKLKTLAPNGLNIEE